MTLTNADRMGIRDLVFRYAWYADSRRLESLAGLFCADAQLLVPKPPVDLGPVERSVGRPAILAAMQGLRQIPVTMHTVDGHVIDPGAEAGTAVGIVSGSAHHLSDRRSGEVSNLVWYLRYQDLYQQEQGDWRFASRALQIEWIEQRPVRQRRRGVDETAPQATTLQE